MKNNFPAKNNVYDKQLFNGDNYAFYHPKEEIWADDWKLSYDFEKRHDYFSTNKNTQIIAFSSNNPSKIDIYIFDYDQLCKIFL